MDDLLMFYPLIIFLLFFFFDPRKRRKAPDRSPELPEIEDIPPVMRDEVEAGEQHRKRQTKQSVPWYVEFPEDRPTEKILKSQGRIYKEREDAFKEPLAQKAPATIFKPSAPKKQGNFKKLGRSQMLTDNVRFGFVMAQILDKPRSLKPYE